MLVTNGDRRVDGRKDASVALLRAFNFVKMDKGATQALSFVTDVRVCCRELGFPVAHEHVYLRVIFHRSSAARRRQRCMRTAASAMLWRARAARSPGARVHAPDSRTQSTERQRLVARANEARGSCVVE